MSSSNNPLRIGITGGIGCGKSTVLAVFESLGVPTFVADSVAAGYYSDPDFLAEVADLLGPSVVRPDGSADKQAIASIVFADKARLQQLNAIIHPRVRQDFDNWCLNQSSRYVLFESAILYEYGFDTSMDGVISIYLDLEERIRRLVLRDKVSRHDIEMRIANQIPAEEKMMRSDWVILNYEGNPRLRQVEHVHSQILNLPLK